MLLLVTDGKKVEKAAPSVIDETVKNLLILLYPMVPHFCSEMWSIRGFESSLDQQSWPTWDEDSARELLIRAYAIFVLSISGDSEAIDMIEHFETMKKQLGVEYVYEEIKTDEAVITVTSDDLKGLPDDWLSQFREDAILGNDKVLLNSIGELGSEHEILAKKLSKLVRDFRFNEINKLCIDNQSKEINYE